jgi:glycolate oxidase
VLDPRLGGELAAILGRDRFLTRPADLIVHGYDAALHVALPGAVAMPTTTEEVSAILRCASDSGTAVVTRGAATSLTGAPVPDRPGSLVVDLCLMDRILAVDTEDMTATVEAGVVTGELQRVVEERGLFYPPDPATLKTCTIGGNIATNAGGPRGLKYGVTRNYVLALEVVAADGTVLHVGSRAIKNATGYALAQLFVGSEGTLGIITRAVLRLIPRPPAERTILAAFDRLDDAAALVVRVLGSGVLPATIEIIDQACIRAVEAYKPAGLPVDVEAVMLLRVDGHPAAVQAEQEAVAALCREAGARDVRVPTTSEEAERLWEARRAVSPALGRLSRDKLDEDISVPRSAIVPVMRRIQAIAASRGLPIAVFGHISDGNLHPEILFNMADADQRDRMLGAASDLFSAALEFGGTLSGEHGLGYLKKEFLPLAVEPAVLGLMRSLKNLLDPAGILNPGKVLPDGHSLISPMTGIPATPPNPFLGPFPTATGRHDRSPGVTPPPDAAGGQGERRWRR